MDKTFEQGLEEVAAVCEYFRANRAVFVAPGFERSRFRQTLIDPLFAALGWNVHHDPPVAPHLREVVPEDSHEVFLRRKPPGQVFRIGTSPRFLVEDRPCGARVSSDAQAAYQLRRYGWNAKIPLAILTDFDQLAVYDCLIRPEPSDQACRARILLLRWDEFVDRWRELWSLFSRESARSRTFEQVVRSKRKRAATDVDIQFLRDGQRWRERLTRNMALRNPNASSEDLTAAVQDTIARVLLLRMAEERGLESFGQLLELCQQPDGYARFLHGLWPRAAEKYHSGSFYGDEFYGGERRAVPGCPDRLRSAPALDDQVFNALIESLYAAHGSPYDFRVLPVQILGTVHERSLGKVTRLTAGHPVASQRKSGASKAGGVYYTPPCIVAHVVKHTVGPVIEGKSPVQLAGSNGQPPLRVLDMSCGSGAFLLGAYQCLLDHYLAWHLAHQPASQPQAIVQNPHTGEWRLTIDQRKRILITHLFGVDIDPQAVDVTRRSLLLKAFEGADDAACSSHPTLHGDRALPNLAPNIKCGNALIGPEFHVGNPDGHSQLPTRDRINGFDWRAEFPEIMQSGGFHAILGNPPYINARILFQQQGEEVKRYFGQRYQTARGGYDLYVLFVERSLELTQPGGRCGMILPNKIASLDYAEACRGMLLEKTTIEQITDVSEFRVFPTAGVYPYVIVWQNATADPSHAINVLQPRDERELSLEQTAKQLRQRELSASGGFSIHGSLDVESRAATLPLGQRAELHSGTTGFAAAQRAASLCEKAAVQGGEYFEFIVSGNIDRYGIEFGKVRFMNRTFIRPVLAAEHQQLTENKRRLFRESKLVFAGMTRRLEVAWDATGGVALGVSVYAACRMVDHPLYLLGVLNSRLLSYLFRIRFQAKHLAGGFLAVNKGQLARLPIRVIDWTIAEDKRRHDEIVDFSQRMMSLVRQREGTGWSRADIPLEHPMQSVDRSIDQLVYELYRLTDAEIRVVEQSTAAESLDPRRGTGQGCPQGRPRKAEKGS